jgi:hypothetical protein
MFHIMSRCEKSSAIKSGLGDGPALQVLSSDMWAFQALYDSRYFHAFKVSSQGAGGPFKCFSVSLHRHDILAELPV